MTSCKNCKYELDDKQDYCGRCGGRIIRNRLTISNLLSYFIENFLNYDNRFLQTVKDLFVSPELVINGYIGGLRKKYNSPINFFAISLTISGLYIFFIQKFYPDIMKVYNFYDDEASRQVSGKVAELLMDYNSLFYFVLIPFLALVSRIVFLRNGYNYTEHVVIYLYTMSLSAILTSVLSFVILFLSKDFFFIWGLVFNFLMIIYHTYILKRVFSLSAAKIFLKFLLFLVIFGFFYVAISIAVAMYFLFFTEIDLKDLAPPNS